MRISSTSAVAMLIAGAVVVAAADLEAGQQPPVNVPSAVGAATCGRAQNSTFRDRSFFDPLIADPRAPQLALNLPAFAPAFPHSIEDGTRFIWDISVGREMPIFTRANFTEGTFGKGCSGWGIWVDVSFHVVEELGKDESNPIINTDYRFSAAKLKYFRILSVGEEDVPSLGKIATFRSLGIRADLLHHESTHLGDEYVIHAQGLSADELNERNQRPFERFNPSLEFFDLGVAYNFGNRLGRLTSLRGGTTAPVPWKWSKGYYSDHTLEPDPRPVARSARKFEPYLQFEHHWPHNFVTVPGTLTARHRFKPFVSVDARHRIVFDYYKTSSDQKEDQQWSFNVLGGMRSWSGAQRYALKEFYLRVYHGVNPAGQLRAEKDYWQAGFGINFTIGN